MKIQRVFHSMMLTPQESQARNMSMGIVAKRSKYEDLYVKNTYRFSFCNLR